VSEKRWLAGEVVVLRYVETTTSAQMVLAVMGDPALIRGVPFLENGQYVTVGARPYRVIEDSEEVTALFQPEGTAMARWHIAEGQLLPQPQLSQGDSLRLFYPGRPYDVTMFFEAHGEPPWLYDGLFEGEGLRDGWRERRQAVGEDAFRGPPRPVEPGRFRGWYVNVQTPFKRTSYGFDIADMTLDVVVRPDRSWYLKDEDELATAIEKGACSEAQAAAIKQVGEGVIQLIESGSAPFDEIWRRWLPFPREAIRDIPDGWQALPNVEPGWPDVS
jgi:Protein of unknown function (DUF402)